MGLGLHIVRRVVDIYEGSVGMSYEDGEVVFRVELPSPPKIALAEVPTSARAAAAPAGAS
jgi:nitrogen-specific signal transduction histidine kinase